MLVFHISPCCADLCSLEGRWHHMRLQETCHHPASSCPNRIHCHGFAVKGQTSVVLNATARSSPESVALTQQLQSLAY